MAYNGYINQNPNQNQPQQQSYFNNINQQTQFQQQNIQPLFPQPQGNVYNINSTLEVANVPVSAGMSVALCLNEGFMYIKTMQNGNPMFWAYKILPYDSSKPPQAKTVRDFLDMKLKGRWLITMNGHITCVIDGILYDTFDCSDRYIWCVYEII